jgi:hypothetical protein
MQGSRVRSKIRKRGRMSDAFETLITAPTPAGFLKWRCLNSGQDLIFLRLPKIAPTESVTVYKGERLVFKRKNVNPGQTVQLLLPSDSYQRWLLRQATEPLTLTVRIRIDPNPKSGCLTYLPPTVHLKSVSDSH